MKKLLMLIAVIAIMSVVPYVQAAIIWSEDFSDISDWEIVWDPGSGSTITSDGDLGAMYVDAGSNIAAFVPKQIDANFVSFTSANASNYTLCWDVDSLTSSTSWNIEMDQFDSSKSYLSTVWGSIYPASGTSTETGSLSKNLSGFGWDANTAYITPKIIVHAEDPAQTVYFDSMEMDVVPEPGTMILLGSGLMGILAISRRRI